MSPVFVSLPTLVELKLASGLTGGPDRLKDLADVSELIKVLELDEEFAEQLDDYVRPKFVELWSGIHGSRRYVRLWRNKFLTMRVSSLEEMIGVLEHSKHSEHSVEELKSMLRDGVVLDPGGGTADDYALLVTTDRIVAERYGMEDESELWGDWSDDS